MHKRIQEAADRAQEAFWASLVGAFPEVVTGDFPPDAHMVFGEACLSAASTWVTGNLPDEDEDEPSNLSPREAQSFTVDNLLAADTVDELAALPVSSASDCGYDKRLTVELHPYRSGSESNVMPTETVEIPVDLLASIIGMADSHVDDIESGLLDFTYCAEENRDLPKKQEAVKTARSLLLSEIKAQGTGEESQADKLRETFVVFRTPDLSPGDYFLFPHNGNIESARATLLTRNSLIDFL